MIIIKDIGIYLVSPFLKSSVNVVVISWISVVPVKPYKSTTPYNNIAELIAANIKNFKEDSVDLLVLCKADNAIKGSVVSSIDKYRNINSDAEESNIIPEVENSIRA